MIRIPGIPEVFQPWSNAPPLAPLPNPTSSKTRYWCRWLLTWHAETLAPPQRTFLCQLLTARGTIAPKASDRVVSIVERLQREALP